MVKVQVTVVKRTTSEAIVTMEVDDNEDQWTTFEKASKMADDAASWREIDCYTDRFHSQVKVVE